MTKTKAQLRREAVERLRDYHDWEPSQKSLGNITLPIWPMSTDMSNDQRVDALIDLLTDDTHESRGSYEERLYDVPVSDCPYCGCERVVIHDFSDIYEQPHSYRVEHMDEKEAFNAGCFETYYSFDSVEKAVEHANMRVLPADDETCPNDNGTCPDADGTASNTHESHGDAQRSVLSANADTDEGEDAETPETARECADSREKLEEDVRVRFGDGLVRSVVMRLLDRQAAITERHWMEICGVNANGWITGENGAQMPDLQEVSKTPVSETDAKKGGRIADMSEKKAESVHESDGMSDSREKLEADVANVCWGFGWQREVKQEDYIDDYGVNVREDITTSNYSGHVLATIFMHMLDRQAAITRAEDEKACADCRDEQIDVLEANNTQLHTLIAELKAERDAYRNKLGRAIDKAHEIVRMVDE